MTAAMQPPPDEGNEMDEVVRARFMGEVDRIQEASEGVFKALRSVGLYGEGGIVGQVDTPLGVKPTFVVPLTVGRVAFSKRVQTPMDKQIDDEFAAIAKTAADDEFLDIREKMQKRLDAGEDPFDLEDPA